MVCLHVSSIRSLGFLDRKQYSSNGKQLSKLQLKLNGSFWMEKRLQQVTIYVLQRTLPNLWPVVEGTIFYQSLQLNTTPLHACVGSTCTSTRAIPGQYPVNLHFQFLFLSLWLAFCNILILMAVMIGAELRCRGFVHVMGCEFTH